MPSKRKRSDKQKLEIVRYWSKWFYDHTDTFNGALGRQLAYLFPAILFDNVIEVSPRSSIVKILKREGIKPESHIWEFLDIVGP